MGTLINAGAIALSAVIGMVFKKGIPKHISDAVIRVMGVCIFMVGLTGALQSMAVITDSSISFDGSLILILSMAVGSVVGEVLRLADRFEKFGHWAEEKLKIDGFASGFIAASMLFCIGAMAILGAIEEGLTGSYDILKTKAVIDFVMGIMLTASMGVGVGLGDRREALAYHQVVQAVYLVLPFMSVSLVYFTHPLLHIGFF